MGTHISIISNITNFQVYVEDVIGYNKLLTYKDVAKICTLTVRTLYNDKSQGLLIPINIFSAIPRFSISEVYSYLLKKHILPSEADYKRQYGNYIQ